MAFVALVAFILLLFPLIIAALLGEEIHIFEQLPTYVDAIVFYIGQGMDIVWLFVPKAISLVCMSFSITANVLRYTYKFILWVLKKVPFLHIS